MCPPDLDPARDGHHHGWRRGGRRTGPEAQTGPTRSEAAEHVAGRPEVRTTGPQVSAPTCRPRHGRTWLVADLEDPAAIALDLRTCVGRDLIWPRRHRWARSCRTTEDTGQFGSRAVSMTATAAVEARPGGREGSVRGMSRRGSSGGYSGGISAREWRRNRPSASLARGPSRPPKPSPAPCSGQVAGRPSSPGWDGVGGTGPARRAGADLGPGRCDPGPVVW